jgi:hypothetical protein
MAEWLISKFVDPYTSEWYMLIKVFGIANIVLVLLALSLFILRRINKHVFSNKNAAIKNIVKPLSKVHPIIGTLLLISAYVHGDLAFDGDWLLGSIFRVHTGPLAWWVLLVMMLVATIGKKFRVKNWLKIHRTLAIVMIVAVVLHLYVRNLFG